MAKGFPDYRLSVDLSSQSLAQIINRPKYGVRGVAEYAGYVGASQDTQLFEISGKGMIYGGAMFLQGAATCKNDEGVSQVDGGPKYGTSSFDTYNTFSAGANFGASWQPACFDEINFRYAIALQMGITFETSLKIFYKETYGRTPYVACRIMYAVI